MKLNERENKNKVIEFNSKSMWKEAEQESYLTHVSLVSQQCWVMTDEHVCMKAGTAV